MPEPVIDPAATPNPADAKPVAPAVTDPNLLSEAGKETPAADPGKTPNVLDDAAKAAQAAKEAEDKRLLETPEDQLSEEDKAKKAEVVKAKEAAKTKADADAKAKQVPEKYEFKVPEGMSLDQGFVDKITPVFKEMKLSQADAQKLADIYAQNLKAQSEAQAASFKQYLKESYDETVKALGPKYKEELAHVAKIRDRFLSPETREMLDASGLSNNKALILDLIKLGKLISEDKLVNGKPDASGGKSRAETIYGKP
jgi:hypothetical protein